MKRIGFGLAMLLLTLIPAGNRTASASESLPALVRVVHAVPDAPAVEICVNGSLAVPSITYPNQTGFLPVPAGTLHAQVFLANTACSATGALIDATITVDSGQVYTVAAVGSLTSGIKGQVLRDANANPAGAALVRFAHFSPDAPAVVVTAQGAGKIFGPISFPNATDYLRLPAGTYNVSVALASAPDSPVVNVPNLQVQSGHIYTAYALGFANPASSKAYAVSQALMAQIGDDTIPSTFSVPLSALSARNVARVRVAHASPGAPHVDVYVDGQRAFANAPFGAVTGYAYVPAGSHHVQVFPAGASPTGKGVIDATVTVKGGTSYTVAAIGKLASISPLVLRDTNRMPLTGYARVRLVHAAPGAPAVDVAVEGGPTLFHGINYGAASRYLTVKAGTYNLVVRPTGSRTVVLRLPHVRLSTGTVYSVFAEGLLGSRPALRAVVSVDRARTA